MTGPGVPPGWQDVLAGLFAQLQAEGFGVAQGASFVAFEGLEEFSAVRLEMLLGLADEEQDR